MTPAGGQRSEKVDLPTIFALDFDARVAGLTAMVKALADQDVQGAELFKCDEALYQFIEAYNAAVTEHSQH